MIDYKIYSSVNELPDSWDQLPTQDVFLKTPFLRGLENATPYNISAFYLCVYKSEKLVAIANIQRIQMYVDDVFRKSSKSIFKQSAKQLVSKIVKGNALVVGNLMHTGQHGLFFLESEMTQDDYLSVVSRAIKELTKKIRLDYGKKVRIIAFKDYFKNDAIHNSNPFFKAQNLYKAQVQPNMILTILDSWKTPQDYVSAFNKKYLKRYKTARKKLASLDCKELELDFIEENSALIFELYETVSDNASVNSFKLPENHFLSLKQNLQDKFKMFGFFLEGKLAGFYSLILNHDVLETYFLGYNKELQHQHQMYLNMLFNMTFFGIENKFKTIVYARTAMEIKSSIGAKPNQMYIYLKHTNNFVANTVLKCIFKYMNPIKKWDERYPFK